MGSGRIRTYENEEPWPKLSRAITHKHLESYILKYFGIFQEKPLKLNRISSTFPHALYSAGLVNFLKSSIRAVEDQTHPIRAVTSNIFLSVLNLRC